MATAAVIEAHLRVAAIATVVALGELRVFWAGAGAQPLPAWGAKYQAHGWGKAGA
jgi:hypothetical protein